jgi:hypothetical protein
MRFTISFTVSLGQRDLASPSCERKADEVGVVAGDSISKESLRTHSFRNTWLLLYCGPGFEGPVGILGPVGAWGLLGNEGPVGAAAGGLSGGARPITDIAEGSVGALGGRCGLFPNLPMSPPPRALSLAICLSVSLQNLVLGICYVCGHTLFGTG